MGLLPDFHLPQSQNCLLGMLQYYPVKYPYYCKILPNMWWQKYGGILYPHLMRDNTLEQGSYHFLLGRGGGVCLWGGGDQQFLGWSKGGPVFFLVGQRGDQNFLRVKEGGPNFFPKVFCLEQFAIWSNWSNSFSNTLFRKFSPPSEQPFSIIIYALLHFHI